MKIIKGSYGYLKSQKKKTVLRTLLLYTISLAIFLTGYLTTHTKANLFTIVAVLGLLPASRSAVEMILFLRQRECDDKMMQKISAHVGKIPCAYELVLTSYEKNFPLTAIIATQNMVYGYTEYEKCDSDAAEKHIKEMLMQNGWKPTVKIFKEVEPFISRLDTLQSSETKVEEKNTEILEVIKAISI